MKINRITYDVIKCPSLGVFRDIRGSRPHSAPGYIVCSFIFLVQMYFPTLIMKISRINYDVIKYPSLGYLGTFGAADLILPRDTLSAHLFS